MLILYEKENFVAGLNINFTSKYKNICQEDDDHTVSIISIQIIDF